MSSKILFEGSFPCEFGFMRGAGSEENLCAFLWDLQPELRADFLEPFGVLGAAYLNKSASLFNFKNSVNYLDLHYTKSYYLLQKYKMVYFQ